MDSQTQQLAQVQSELDVVQQELERTVGQLASLQQEHATLVDEHAAMNSQLAAVEEDKRQLEAKLSSLKELKLAIKDVKRKMWAQRWVRWRARAEAQRQADQERLAAGNRGYVVRDGTSTLVGPTKLQVHVLEPQPQ